MWWPAVVKSEWEEFPLRLDYGRSPHAYVNQRLQIQLELLMMSGIPLETCWAFNERWNNKFCYKVASCWLFLLKQICNYYSRSQWPRGLMRRSPAARLLRLWVRIPPGVRMFVCCECRVLSGRGLCDEVITHPEESYRLWYVVVCDLETSRMRKPWPALGRSATEKKSITVKLLGGIIF